MARVRPNEMEEAVRDVGSSHAGIKLLEEPRHLTDEALARDFRHFAHVLVRWDKERRERRGRMAIKVIILLIIMIMMNEFSITIHNNSIITKLLRLPRK